MIVLNHIVVNAISVRQMLVKNLTISMKKYKSQIGKSVNIEQNKKQSKCTSVPDAALRRGRCYCTDFATTKCITCDGALCNTCADIFHNECYQCILGDDDIRLEYDLSKMKRINRPTTKIRL